ncbi:sensor histidine kinase [Futiania mangrovi]|uniref:histidine kinase n=1 Tax=Futiania mangrovi TaxID=2959716 RepID=A0A9J6PBA3_9PROT|nr:HAMP domain-containing sensor histidine kinase [Futiania mangrovii]MCP1334795.1 HAMP domain-containing histidine kinase [Futiania mangrovii]
MLRLWEMLREDRDAARCAKLVAGAAFGGAFASLLLPLGPLSILVLAAAFGGAIGFALARRQRTHVNPGAIFESAAERAEDPLSAEELRLLARRCNAEPDVLTVWYQQMMERFRTEVQSREAAIAAAREAQEAAERANLARAQFLTNMSHELRTPLNAVIGMSDVMRRQTFGPLGHDNYMDYANHIQESGRYLLGMIDDILTLTECDAREDALMLDSADPLEIVRAAAAQVRGAAAAGCVHVSVKAAPNLPAELEADSRRLQRAIWHLLANAVAFTPPGGKVGVYCTVTEDGRLAVCIRDNGRGMDPAQIRTARSILTQGDESWTKRHGGTGIGIPFATRIAELHGGRLRIDSTPGKGTIASIVLPARSAGSVRRLTPAGAHPRTPAAPRVPASCAA